MRVPFSRTGLAFGAVALIVGSAAGPAQTAEPTNDIVTTAVKVDNANVVRADIVATNGVIHVIDAVILPH